MNYQNTSNSEDRTYNSFAYYGAWPAMIVWGLDVFIRLVRFAILNFAYLNPWSSKNSQKELDAVIEVLSPRLIRVSLHRPRYFHWCPGQNVYLSIPSISTLPFEFHPFTISTIDNDSGTLGDNTLVFLFRVQRGFTQKILKEASPDTTYRVLINGPYGSPPLLIGYQTIMLIAGSSLLSLHLTFLIGDIGGSGVAFTLPLFLEVNNLFHFLKLLFVLIFRL
jgi:predicted ferric reductase